MHKTIATVVSLALIFGSGIFIPPQQAEAKSLAECNSSYSSCTRRCYDAASVSRFVQCKRTCRSDYLACGETLPITGTLDASKGDPKKAKPKPAATK